MVEEIKMSWKAYSTKPLHLFVGKVSSINIVGNLTTIIIEGKDLTLVQSNKFSITLTNADQLDAADLYFVKDLSHIQINDILVVKGNNIRSLYRNESKNNSIFATVRCNSNCLMCSQPPLDYDDTKENLIIWDYTIDLMPEVVKFIGFTGGEPTLLGNDLVYLVNKLAGKYPDIIIDILSNGRLQAKEEFKDILAKINKPNNVIFAIPLYSDIYKEHDYIVQAKDAFYQTILGIHNLASLGFQIEIRVVLHELSVRRLFHLSKFIHKNIPFVAHVALMGLENIGYTKANKNILYIQDNNFIQRLTESISFLESWKYNVSIYNMPFCHLPNEIWKNARQSISDWKNSFKPECEKCFVKDKCAGFFSWNLDSAAVYPLQYTDQDIFL